MFLGSANPKREEMGAIYSKQHVNHKSDVRAKQQESDGGGLTEQSRLPI
jgi:hypothetical protein